VVGGGGGGVGQLEPQRSDMRKPTHPLPLPSREGSLLELARSVAIAHATAVELVERDVPARYESASRPQRRGHFLFSREGGSPVWVPAFAGKQSTPYPNAEMISSSEAL